MYKLLIVEDEEIVRDYLKRNIAWESIGVIAIGTASNGMEGIEMAMAVKPDIIITDIKMPGMSGLEMVKSIKCNLPGVKTIILSGYNDFNFAREAIELKVFTYLLKPFEDDDVLETMKKVISEIQGASQPRLDIPQPDEQMKSDINARLINKVLKIIEEEFMEGISLAIIADRVYISPNHLGQVFYKSTGKTFNSYLTDFRMQKAKMLLVESTRNLSDIARMVGINDETYFCTLFKSFYGTTPGKYRKLYFLNR